MFAQKLAMIQKTRKKGIMEVVHIGKLYKVPRTAPWAQIGIEAAFGKCIWIHPEERFFVVRFEEVLQCLC